ncbi:MAG: hypothetical protein OHK0052_09720 [Anaerolineales bacterium]
MRITRETLLKIARDTVAQRRRDNRALVGVYLRGSLLGEQFLLGGTTDIDLVFIHEGQPPQAREIVRLTDAIHLDIEHHARREYTNPRELRVHPWLGPTLFYCQILHDPQHFLDFTQASIRGQFDTPEHIWQRAYPQLTRARQNWLGLQMSSPENAVTMMQAYLDLLQDAFGALLSLTGGLLPTRRLLLDLPARVQALGMPHFAGGLLKLLGAPALTSKTIVDWIPTWQRAFEGARALNLHPARLEYYRAPLQELANSPQPASALWLLLRTWTEAASGSTPSAELMQEWQNACGYLNLDESTWATRLDQMDVLLDEIEEFLETWGKRNGLI